MKFIGVDGCRYGWFSVSIDFNSSCHLKTYLTIKDIWNHHQNASLILIDIPIGLPDTSSRTCDREARKLLKHRASCVFPAPSRETVYTIHYNDACRINKKISGKKLSRQAWNITAKIRQTDEFLLSHPQARYVMRESHPELCFWALNGGHSMKYNKKTEPGFQERLAVLQKIYHQTEHIFQQAITNHKRQDVGKDDILDAICLAITAAMPAETHATLPALPEKDLKKLSMEIVYSKRYLNNERS